MRKIITFEGIDGSGKTTLMTRLYKHFIDLGKEVWSTSEPWSFFDVNPDPFVATMELMADRRRHCQELKYTRFDIALIDRFDLSTKAYQGYGDGVDLALINALNAVATEGIDVSLRIWLDLPVEVAVKRLKQRGETVSTLEIDRLKRISRGYASMTEWNQLRRIDATQPPEDVLREAIALIEEVL